MQASQRPVKRFVRQPKISGPRLAELADNKTLINQVILNGVALLKGVKNG